MTKPAGGGCVVAFALVLSPGMALGEAPALSGPLRFADQFLLTMGTLALEPLPLDLVDGGAWQAELTVSTANTFTRSRSVEQALEARSERLPVTEEFLDRIERESEIGEPLFFVDGESLRTELRLRRGLSNGLELEVRLAFVEFHGGWMDELLEEFHDVAGLDQDGRLGVPKNRTGVFLELADRDLALSPESSLTLADPLLAIRGQRRLRKPGRRLVWDAAVKIPVANEDNLVSSGSMDVAVQAQWSACKPRRCRFAALNLRDLGKWEELGLSSRLVPGFYAGLERRWKGASWVVQLVVAGSPLDGVRIEGIDAETWQLSSGVHRRLGAAFSMTAAVTENVAHFENGPDLAFHWALRRGF